MCHSPDARVAHLRMRIAIAFEAILSPKITPSSAMVCAASSRHPRIIENRINEPKKSVNRLPTLSLPLRVLIEEANHLRGGVWALGIGVGAGGATARPRVPESVDGPPLRDGAPPASW